MGLKGHLHTYIDVAQILIVPSRVIETDVVCKEDSINVLYNKDIANNVKEYV